MFGVNTPYESLNLQLQNAASEVQVDALIAKSEATSAAAQAKAANFAVQQAYAAVELAKVNKIALAAQSKAWEAESRARTAEREACNAIRDAALFRSAAPDFKAKQAAAARVNPVETQGPGGMRIINLKDYDRAEILNKIGQNYSRDTAFAVSEKMKQENHYGLLTIQNNNIVGILIGEVQPNRFSFQSFYEFGSDKEARKKSRIILVLEAMQRAKDMNLELFSYRYASASGYGEEVRPTEEDGVYSNLNQMLRRCNIKVDTENKRVFHSYDDIDYFESVSYNLKNFDLNKVLSEVARNLQ